MSVGSSKLTLAALGVLAAGTTSGVVPVGRFLGPRPWKCVLPRPIEPTTHTRVGPVGVDAELSHGKVAPDGTFYVDVRLTADEVKAARRPVDLALVVDVSGSMQEHNRIGLLRQACERLATELGPDDRVALVSFSTDAQTVFPLGTVTPAYEEAVRRLVPCGGTNIGAGLERGAAELRRSARPGAARRLLLLTDGQPTVGLQQPEALKGVARRLAGEGFSLGAVGLGLDWNGPLLSAMAELGGGVSHAVEAPDRIAGIYEAELRALRAQVARNVAVKLTPAPGFEIVDVIGWQATRWGQECGTSVRVGDLESGRRTKVVARLRATGAAPGVTPVVSVAVELEDASGRAFAGDLGLTAERVSDPALARASVNPGPRADIEEALVSLALEEARCKAEAGDVAGARTALRRLGRDEVQYKAADGRVEKMTVRELEHALCDEPAGDAQKRARLHANQSVQSLAR